jgi:hypothetical protein
MDGGVQEGMQWRVLSQYSMQIQKKFLIYSILVRYSTFSFLFGLFLNVNDIDNLLVQDRSGSVKTSRCSETDIRTTIFAGSSKSYESLGAQIIAERLHAKYIKLASVIKDGDSNCLSKIKEFYPDILAIQDVNHVVKNISKHVKAAAKETCPGLKGRSYQIQNHIYRILKFIHRCEKVSFTFF